MLFDQEYKRILLEFSEGAIRKIVQKFSDEASEQEIRREVQDFEKYKNSLQKKDPFQYKSWIEFTEAIHAAKGKAEFKSKKIPDESQITSTDDIIADDENVTIYKGDSQDKCVMYGKGYTFCISRPAGGNMYSNYRFDAGSTFYFIFFKKKPKSDPEHIMVLDHSKNGYLWTFADNNTKKVKGGWEEIVNRYPELSRYKELLINKELSDEEKRLNELNRQFMILNQRRERNSLGNYVITDDAAREILDFWNKITYQEKIMVLKEFTFEELPDIIWNKLDSTMRNEFFGVAPNLTYEQAIRMSPKEIERYKNVRRQFYDHIIETGDLGEFEPNVHDDRDFIIKDPYVALHYAYHIKDTDLDFDDDIVEAILEYGEAADEFVNSVLKNDVSKWERVPEYLLSDVVGDGAELLPDEIRKKMGWPIEDEDDDYEQQNESFFNKTYYKLLQEWVT